MINGKNSIEFWLHTQSNWGQLRACSGECAWKWPRTGHGSTPQTSDAQSWLVP